MEIGCGRHLPLRLVNACSSGCATMIAKEHAVKILVATVVGRPAAALARHVDAGHCDLLVLGSHGRGRLGNFVLGSVAAEGLACCRIPVLVVR